jgi:hypothetical protein
MNKIKAGVVACAFLTASMGGFVVPAAGAKQSPDPGTRSKPNCATSNGEQRLPKQGFCVTPI